MTALTQGRYTARRPVHAVACAAALLAVGGTLLLPTPALADRVEKRFDTGPYGTFVLDSDVGAVTIELICWAMKKIFRS